MERKLFECKRCGHKWLSSKEHPILCAKCHSAYWDTPKVSWLGKKATRIDTKVENK